jgi:hypothetical protein
MLTDNQIAAIKTELSREEYRGINAQQAYALLHDPRPEKATGVVPKPLSIARLLEVLSPETIARLADWPHLTDLRDKIVADDREGVALWGQLLVAAGKITTEEFNAVSSELTATEDTETTELLPPRIVTAFRGIAGMPNAIPFEEFAAIFGS